ncbi:ABC transporter ATP-binding protein [Acholeplasma equirhinis]|uniref:ABC transporter ATP-binding protein n=1 Tax=Acholeplasma equirhinis TaxID=555393 RepID=UPI00197A9C75|nr:ABC transporter ATP-binding protein [Acholeplasma equirhinis]MBN3490133.1 ABC transporter ATP-binding protein [Acholeplasma equirhinis]
MDKKPLIELINISKIFDAEAVVNNINLTIYKNEFVTLLGPSGCGKTTTLRMIGGFENPDAGTILIEGKDFSDIPSYARPINTVFQKYALFPHLNVIDNVAFGLNHRPLKYLAEFYKDKIEASSEKKNIRKLIKTLIYEDAKSMLRLVKLEGYDTRKIDQLSGGQQQRVALARALINRPKILLLDEPLAALDLKLRQNMQYELKEMQNKLGITFIFVTHDQEEAMTMSDRIVVMKNGIIEQIGVPKKIYNEPVNRYVARFIGETNIFPGTITDHNEVTFLGSKFKYIGYDEFNIGDPVDVVIRPEDFDVVPVEKATIKGLVTFSLFKGVHNELIVNIDNQEVLVNDYESFELGSQIGLKVDPYEIHLMRVSNENK